MRCDCCAWCPTDRASRRANAFTASRSYAAGHGTRASPGGSIAGAWHRCSSPPGGTQRMRRVTRPPWGRERTSSPVTCTCPRCSPDAAGRSVCTPPRTSKRTTSPPNAPGCSGAMPGVHGSRPSSEASRAARISPWSAATRTPSACRRSMACRRSGSPWSPMDSTSSRSRPPRPSSDRRHGGRSVWGPGRRRCCSSVPTGSRTGPRSPRSRRRSCRRSRERTWS